MSSGDLDDLQRILDRYGRRVAKEVGGLLVDVGEALRRQAEPGGEMPPPQPGPTRDDLMREAARLGVKGRSRMTKDELREAIERLK